MVPTSANAASWRSGLSSDQLVWLDRLASGEAVFWNNPACDPAAPPSPLITSAMVADAADRLQRFRPCLTALFPELAPHDGVIESSLRPVPYLHKALERASGMPLGNRLLAKLDNELPVSGSIKARGGLYEVLFHAERLALVEGLLETGEDYRKLLTPPLKNLFARHSLCVGSTGNLGLSIGIMGRHLGFDVTVHMSREAKQWKKDKLRSHGAHVIEHDDDYGQAVREGRELALATANCHFIDDERSTALFLGYAVAGERLKAQFAEQHLVVNAEHPLRVYLPCGVGGGPGGVAYGIKLAFGEHAHCYMAEPLCAPAVLIGLMTGLDETIEAREAGIYGETCADGLAVRRPSGLVCAALRHWLDGAATVADKHLLALVAMAARTEGLRLEPAAAAGLGALLEHARCHPAQLAGATSLVWLTGGGMLPQDEWQTCVSAGEALTLS